jgi:hypothetical protein
VDPFKRFDIVCPTPLPDSRKPAGESGAREAATGPPVGASSLLAQPRWPGGTAGHEAGLGVMVQFDCASEITGLIRFVRFETEESRHILVR